MPYVFHPFHLAEQMQDENTTIVALLHDVVEDTDYTLDDLRAMGFGDEVDPRSRCSLHGVRGENTGKRYRTSGKASGSAA